MFHFLDPTFWTKEVEVVLRKVKKNIPDEIQDCDFP